MDVYTGVSPSLLITALAGQQLSSVRAATDDARLDRVTKQQLAN